jgi:hypothetical protein
MMNACSQFHQNAGMPPTHFTPLRASAHIFANDAGYHGCAVKMVESKESHSGGRRVAAWDVYVRAPGSTRGKRIGTMIERACEPLGPYAYRI